MLVVWFGLVLGILMCLEGLPFWEIVRAVEDGWARAGGGGFGMIHEIYMPEGLKEGNAVRIG